MIRIMILAMVLGCGTHSFAAVDLGVEISPVIVDGKLKLGVTHAAQYFGLTVSIPESALAVGTNAQVYAQLVDRNSGAPYSDVMWQKALAAGQPAGSNYVAVAGLSGAQADSARLKIKSLALVLNVAGSGGSKRAYIDLATFCKTSPGSFVNLDMSTTGCD